MCYLHVEPSTESCEAEKQVISEVASKEGSEGESDEEQVFEAYITEDMVTDRKQWPPLDFESEKVHPVTPISLYQNSPLDFSLAT